MANRAPASSLILAPLLLLVCSGCEETTFVAPKTTPTFDPVWPNPVVKVEPKCKCEGCRVRVNQDGSVACSCGGKCPCKDGGDCICKEKPKPKASHYTEARKKALDLDKPLLVWVGQPPADWHWAEHVRVPLGWWGVGVPSVLVCIPKDGDLWCHKNLSSELYSPTANDIWRVVYFATHPEPVIDPAPMPVMQRQLMRPANGAGGRAGSRGGSCGPRG